MRWIRDKRVQMGAAAAAVIAVGLWLVFRDRGPKGTGSGEEYIPEVQVVPIEGAVDVPAIGPSGADNVDLASRRLGGRIESIAGRIDPDPGWSAIHDGDPANYWIAGSSPVEVALSAWRRQAFDVAEVSVEYPSPQLGDASFPDEIRVLASELSPTHGFREVTRAAWPRGGQLVRLALPSPVRARFLRLELSSPSARRGLAVGEVHAIGRLSAAPDLVDLAGPAHPGAVSASCSPSPVDLVTGCAPLAGGLPTDRMWAARADSALPIAIDFTTFRGLPAFLQWVVIDTRIGRGISGGCSPSRVEVRASAEETGDSFLGVARFDLPTEPGAHPLQVGPDGMGIRCRRVRLVIHSLSGSGDRLVMREVTLLGRFRQAPAAGEIREQEPDDEAARPTLLRRDETVCGTAGGGDADSIELDLQAAGNRLDVEGHGLEATLLVFDATGDERLAVPLGLLSERFALPRASAPEGSRVLLRLTGGAASPYRCGLTVAAGDEVEPNDRLGCPQRVVLGPDTETSLVGSFDYASDVDIYSFVVPPGGRGAWSFVLSRVDEVDAGFTLAGPDPDSAVGVPVQEGPPAVLAAVDEYSHPAQEVLGGWEPKAAGEYFLLLYTRSDKSPAPYALKVTHRSK